MSVQHTPPRTPMGTKAVSHDTTASNPDADWSAWFDAQRARVDAALAAHLESLRGKDEPPGRLLEAVEYSLRLPGKRVRPILVLECCRVCGGEADQAMPAALAIECVHTFSLIHDDLPAMDDDDLRRGQPTSHRVFGEALAILAGDWLVAHAFDLLTANPPQPQAVPQLVRTLAAATSAMVVGQAADMAGQQQPTDAALVETIHLHKTASLIEAACRMGALAAGATPDAIEHMGRYGRHLGLAFQIVDDLLDRTGSAATLGKRAGKDASVHKQTYPAAFGMEASRRRAQEHHAAAQQALEPFGDRAGRLRGLASFVIQRDR